MRWSAALQRHRQRLERRLARRGPQLRLNLRNLYILPTGFGGLWLLGTAVLYLLGINGNSNGPLLLAFLCCGLFLLSLFLTQFNLQGLELAVDHPQPAFAGSSVNYPVQVRSACVRHQLQLQFEGGPLQLIPSIPAGPTLIQAPWAPAQRGLHTPGRLKLYSKAPLGLFVCWSYWVPPKPQLIFPQPVAGPVREHWIPAQELRNVLADAIQAGGAETLRELSPHRPEEGLQRVAWKQMARGRGWLAKRFESETTSQLHLSPDPGVDRERALEHLCARILELSDHNQPFGLTIGGLEPIPHGQGRHHREAALRALALA